MKNSTARESGSNSALRKSVSVLLIFASLVAGNVAKAADSKSMLSNQAADVAAIHSNNAARNLSETAPEASKPASEDTLDAQLFALNCFTPYGTFPMRVLLPVGSGCYATFPWYPFGAYGTAW